MKEIRNKSVGNIITNQNTPFDKEIAGQGVRRCCCHCRAEKKKLWSEQLPVISTLHEEYFKTKAEEIRKNVLQVAC